MGKITQGVCVSLFVMINIYAFFIGIIPPKNCENYDVIKYEGIDRFIGKNYDSVKCDFYYMKCLDMLFLSWMSTAILILVDLFCSNENEHIHRD